jgi:polar amino acid transport system substrate-binding protein
VRGRIFTLLVLAAVLAGCEIPQDPDGTLDRVEGGTMRVGATEADPWVRIEGTEPSGGVEVELVERFARDLDARIEWVDGSEEELVNAMKEGSLDLVIGGLTKKTRWKKDVALTRPYVSTRSVVAVEPGGSAEEDFEGVRVAVERGTEQEALLERKTEAEVVPVDSLADANGPVAAEEFVLDDLDLRATGTELKKEKHVMALPFGENAWMVRLERYLLNREDEIERLLREEGRP